MLEIGAIAPDFDLPDQNGAIKPSDNAAQMLETLV